MNDFDHDRPELCVQAVTVGLCTAIVGFLFGGHLSVLAGFVPAAFLGGYVGWSARRLISEHSSQIDES